MYSPYVWGHLDVTVWDALPICKGLSDAHYTVLRLLADHIHSVPASDLFQKFLEPEPECVTGVVQREARNNVLDLVIDSDYDGNLAASKVESGLHHYLRQGIGIGGATISNTSMQQRCLDD